MNRSNTIVSCCNVDIFAYVAFTYMIQSQQRYFNDKDNLTRRIAKPNKPTACITIIDHNTLSRLTDVSVHSVGISITQLTVIIRAPLFLQSHAMNEIKNAIVIADCHELVKAFCQALLLIEQLTLLTFIVVMSLVFIFDDSAASNKVITNSTFFAITFCDEICISIAIVISINDYIAPCDPVLPIAIKCMILFDIICNLRGIDVVVNIVTNIAMKIDFFGIILIAYCIVGTMRATMAILYFIGASIDVIALIFAVIHSILPTKDENKATKQS